MLDLIIDALIDSLKVLGVAFIIHFLLSFVEEKIAHILTKHEKISPLLGASCGLIPQCGISVVAADMYHKQHLSAGTLLAIFFACSDEALPILLTDGKKIIYVLPLLLIKFIFGFVLGYLIDLFLKRKQIKQVEEDIHVGCCGHEIDGHEDLPIHKHLVHPLLHSLKIFLYVFIINLLFGFLIYLIGETKITNFLQVNEWLGPLMSAFIGLIPNCASSVLLSKLFMADGLSFGALITGLCVNAGLGIVYLIKFKDSRKKAFVLLFILFSYSLLIGYLTLLILKVF